MKAFGFNPAEVGFLMRNPWYELPAFYLADDIARFGDPSRPFGNGFDDLDAIDLDTLYARRGASQRARNTLAGQQVNALYGLWRFAVMKDRGIPLSEGETFHLKGGNEELPKAFAARLGARVKLNHPITAIRHDDLGVTVTHNANGHGELHTMRADFLVNCISLPVFQKIPVTPQLSASKTYVVDNIAYSSHQSDCEHFCNGFVTASKRAPRYRRSQRVTLPFRSRQAGVLTCRRCRHRQYLIACSA